MAIFHSFRKVSSLLFTLLFLYSCGGDKKKSNSFSNTYIVPKTETFEVTKQENTQTVSGKVLDDLESYNAETGTYVFSDSADEVEDLEPGKVVLFETHSLRKVTSVRKESGKIIVESEYARLTDYYKDAKISYSAPITWDKSQVSAAKMKIGTPVATMSVPMFGFTNPQNEGEEEQEIESGGDSELHIALERDINGWNVKFELTPEAGGKLNISLTATKGNLCSIKAEGFISSFTSNANIDIQGGETQSASYSNDGMEGEMEVKFAAVGLGSDIAILEIPAEISQTILINGIIPVTLKLKANLKIYPEVAAGSSSQVSMKVKYNSNIGFSYEDGEVTSRGDVTGDSAEQTGDSNTATAGIAGMGVGVEFPRIEISMLGNLIVPYILLDTRTSSYLSTGLLDNRPCHTARCKYEVHVGVSLNFLNIASINNDYKAFEQVKNWVAPGSHCSD